MKRRLTGWGLSGGAVRQAGYGKGMNRDALLKLLTVVFWLALMFTFVMALLPKPPSLPVEAGDKALHMVAFAVLSFLAATVFVRRRVIELFLAMAALGALIEVLQMIPTLHRDAEFADWMADCVASLVVLVLCRSVRRLFAPKAP